MISLENLSFKSQIPTIHKKILKTLVYFKGNNNSLLSRIDENLYEKCSDSFIELIKLYSSFDKNRFDNTKLNS